MEDILDINLILHGTAAKNPFNREERGAGP